MKKNAIALGMVVVSTMLSLSGVEVALRVFGYDGAQARQNITFDEQLGPLPEDAWVRSFEIREDTKNLELNAQRVHVEKTPGLRRILFIGDSGTQGIGVEADKAFPILFHESLRAGGIEVEVLNAGQSGMTTVSEYTFLQNKLLPLAPDVVVLGLFMANDINFNLLHNRLLIDRDFFELFVHRARDVSALADFLYLRFAVLASNQSASGHPPEPKEPSSDLAASFALTDSYGFHYLNYDIGELALYARQPSHLNKAAFSTLRKVLANFLQLASEQKFEFAVVLIPTMSAIRDVLDIRGLSIKSMALALETSGLDSVDFDVRAPTRKVLAICSQLNIVCIDPTPILQRAGRHSIVPGRDDHLSECGHRWVATVLATHFDFRNIQFSAQPISSKQSDLTNSVEPCPPDSSGIYFRSGEIHQKAGRNYEAAIVYNRAIAIDEDHAYAHLNLGLVYKASSQLAIGILHIRRAVELAPNDPNMHYNLGNALLQGDLAAEAVRHYRISLGIRPKQAEAWNNMGVANIQLYAYAEAVRCFDRALQENPQHTSARESLEAARKLLP